MQTLSSNLLIFAQATAKAAKAKAADEPSLLSPWVTLLLILALLAIPILAGTMIARGLKMKEQSTKISVILLSLFLGLSPFVAQYVIGALEHSQYAGKVERWEEKQATREKISAKDLTDLEEAVPSLQGNINFDRQSDQGAKKLVEPAQKSDAKSKTPAEKTPPKTNAKTAN